MEQGDDVSDVRKKKKKTRKDDETLTTPVLTMKKKSRKLQEDFEIQQDSPILKEEKKKKKKKKSRKQRVEEEAEDETPTPDVDDVNEHGHERQERVRMRDLARELAPFQRWSDRQNPESFVRPARRLLKKVSGKDIVALLRAVLTLDEVRMLDHRPWSLNGPALEGDRGRPPPDDELDREVKDEEPGCSWMEKKAREREVQEPEPSQGSSDKQKSKKKERKEGTIYLFDHCHECSEVVPVRKMSSHILSMHSRLPNKKVEEVAKSSSKHTERKEATKGVAKEVIKEKKKDALQDEPKKVLKDEWQKIFKVSPNHTLKRRLDMEVGKKTMKETPGRSPPKKKEEEEGTHCRVCDRRLSCPAALKQHLESDAHSSLKFGCSMCERKFENLGQFGKHLEETRHVIPPKRQKVKMSNFKCVRCEADFTSAFQLRKHVAMSRGDCQKVPARPLV